MLPVNFGLALISCEIVLESVWLLPELIAAMICAEILLGNVVCAICVHCGQAWRFDDAGNAVYEGGLAAPAEDANPAPANARPITATYPTRDFIRASLRVSYRATPLKISSKIALLGSSAPVLLTL